MARPQTEYSTLLKLYKPQLKRTRTIDCLEYSTLLKLYKPQLKPEEIRYRTQYSTLLKLYKPQRGYDLLSTWRKGVV